MTRLFPVMAPGVEAAGETEVTAPYDGALVARVGQVDHRGVDRALATALALFRDRDAWLGPSKRLDVLSKTAEIMAGRREDLASTLGPQCLAA